MIKNKETLKKRPSMKYAASQWWLLVIFVGTLK